MWWWVQFFVIAAILVGWVAYLQRQAEREAKRRSRAFGSANRGN